MTKQTGKRTGWLVAAALLLCAAFLLLPFHENAHAAVKRDSLTRLRLKKLAEFPVPGGGRFLEGGCVTSSGYLLAYLNSATGKPNPLQLLDTGNWKVVKTASALLSHANDMCYIPQRREIYVSPMDSAKLIVLDEDTLAVKKKITVPQNYHAIGYDSVNDRFAGIYVKGKGKTRRLYCNILDGTCREVLNSFPADTNLTYQGLAVYGSLIYCAAWERGSVNALYEPVYDGVFKEDDNVIYVYNRKGKLVNMLLITIPDGYTKFELETISFLNGRMILQFNEYLQKTPNNRIAGIYEVTGGYSVPDEAATKEKEAAEKAAAEREAAEKEAGEETDEEKEAAETAAFQKKIKKFSKAKTKITKLTANKRTVKLGWAGMKIENQNITGYEIQICRKKSFRGKTLQTIQTGGTKLTIRNMPGGTTWYVRIRGYYTADDKTYTSAWSARKKVKTS